MALVYGVIGSSKMWQAISYYGVLALEAVVGVFGIRLYEEPQFDIVGSLKRNRDPPLRSSSRS